MNAPAAMPPVPFAHAHLLLGADDVLACAGDIDRPYPWASVTKVVSSLAILIAIAEAHLRLDTPAGPEGATVAHLLSHSSGLPLDSREPQLGVGVRRIYSNAGIEIAAEVTAAATGVPFGTWMRERVLEPLDMGGAHLLGSPAHGMTGTAADLAQLAAELLAPTLLPADLHERMVAPVLPELAGVVPGYGRFDPCPWGLGVEIRGHKGDSGGHWTAPTSSPRTFGHFGVSGSALWIDPDARLAGVFLGAEPFGAWHKAHWSSFMAGLVADHT